MRRTRLACRVLSKIGGVLWSCGAFLYLIGNLFFTKSGRDALTDDPGADCERDAGV